MNHTADFPYVQKRAVLEALGHHPFRPPWWLRGRHGQTAFAPLFRRLPPVDRHIERLTTPDGDFLNVHLHGGSTGKPLVVMLHGLEGSAHSHYIIGLHHAFARLDWSSAVMEFRSCGPEMNRARRLYHSGETSDLDLVVRHFLSRGFEELYLVGFSLGGNVLAKWLGELGPEAPAQVRAAAVVSVPFDLAASAAYFERTLWGLYGRRFLRSLIPKAVEKARQYPGCLDLDRVRRCRTFRDFDTHATARLHGFRDADDYWAKSSSKPFLARIARPTLLVASADDPFIPAASLPRLEADSSPWLYPQFTEKGGHVGFIGGARLFRLLYWAEDHVVRFFQVLRGNIAEVPMESTYY